MDINSAIDSFLAEIKNYNNEYNKAVQGLTSANRERIGKEFLNNYLKSHSITTEKRGTLSVTYYLKDFSGTIKLTVRDVSKQYVYKGILKLKKEVRRIDTSYKYKGYNICVDIWTSDKVKADQLKVGSVIEVSGNYEISYYNHHDDESINIDYKDSKPLFKIISI